MKISICYLLGLFAFLVSVPADQPAPFELESADVEFMSIEILPEEAPLVHIHLRDSKRREDWSRFVKTSSDGDIAVRLNESLMAEPYQTGEAAISETIILKSPDLDTAVSYVRILLPGQASGATASSDGSDADPVITLRSDPRASASDPITFTLVPTGSVYVLVRQKHGNKELFRRTMRAGERAELKSLGAAEVVFTAGENLTIEKDGQTLRPSGHGTAKLTVE